MKEFIDILRKRTNGEIKMSDSKLLETFFKRVIKFSQLKILLKVNKGEEVEAAFAKSYIANNYFSKNYKKYEK